MTENIKIVVWSLFHKVRKVGWMTPNINYICKSCMDSSGLRPLNDSTLESFTY